MVRLFPSEEFREVEFDIRPAKRYAVSNYGRLMCFTDSVSDGKLLNTWKCNGYHVFQYFIVVDGKRKKTSKTIYNMIGEVFLEKLSEEHRHVIHLDYDRGNDHHSNLKLVTRDEALAHRRKSPYVIAAQKKLVETKIKADGHKLTTTQVMLLKKQIFDPNRKTRLKILAKRFGISEMQLYRIKRGENWGHIKV